MTERIKPSQPEEEKPKQTYFRVNDWGEAYTLAHELTVDGTVGFGTANHYPENYTVVHKDAWSGQGMGYYILRVENGRHVELVADISIGSRKEESQG